MSNRLIIFRPVFAALRPVFIVLWRVFEAFADFMDNFWQIVGVAILTGMWGLLLLNALSRLTGILPINWSMEITGYMVAWSLFVMMGPIARSDQHIKITFLSEKVLGEKRAASFMHAVENLLGLFLCTYLSYHAITLVKETKLLGLTEESSEGWEYPLWIIQSGIVVGFALTALYYFERTVKSIIRLFTGSEVVSGGGSALFSSTQAVEGRPEPETDTKSQTEISDVPDDNEISNKEQE